MKVSEGCPICGGRQFNEIHGDKIEWICVKCQLLYAPPPTLKSPEEILGMLQKKEADFRRLALHEDKEINQRAEDFLVFIETIKQFITGAKTDDESTS